MALSTSCLSFAQGVCAGAGVSVAASLAVPDNCPEVLLLNTSAANAVLYGLGQPGVTVLVEGTTAARLPAGASVTLAIGMLGDR